MKTPDSKRRRDETPEDSSAGAEALEEKKVEGEDEGGGEGESEPRREPWVWTPAKVLEWNAYYDLYVVGLVFLLVFVASATRVSTSTFWTHLQAGRLIAEKGGPLTGEPFAYTRAGQGWTNLNWLHEVASYEIYALVAGLELGDPDQYGVAALGILGALLRGLTVLALVSIRHRGPGKWWAALVTTLAFGVILGPVVRGETLRLGISLGGIAARGTVLPETWGIFLLAVMSLILFRASSGKRGGLLILPLLFALWVNVDETFASGLVLLAAWTLGEVVQGRRAGGDVSAGTGRWLGVLAASAGACFLNPGLHRAFGAAFAPLLEPYWPSSTVRTVDQLSLFGPAAARYFQQVHGYLVGIYAVLVGLGLGSFALNWSNFRLGRFLGFVLAAVLWGSLYRMQDVFAVVWAITLTLNGQEWYQRVFGTEGRVSLASRTWSVGGRLATLAVVTLAVLKAMTGYGGTYLEPTFGPGYDRDEFAFDAADFLASSPVQGRVLNLKLSQGDALNWRAYPLRAPYLDTRRIRAAGPLLDEMEAMKKALASGKKEEWAPLLDKYGITVVMVDLQNAAQTVISGKLSESADWTAFHDDGDTMLFGRMDTPGEDGAYFRSKRLDAENLAFKVDHPVRAFSRPPSALGWMDRVFQARTLATTQPRVKAAQRWLGRELVPEATGGLGPGLAACLLTIQEARNALSSKPDDTDAYYVQSLAYRRLGDLEARLLARAGEVDPTGEAPGPLRMRLQQRMTALNFAIQTAPKPPRTEYARTTLRNMYYELSNLLQTQGFLDLARDRLADAIELTPADELDPAAQETLDALSEEIELVRSEMEQGSVEGQADPVQLATFAMSRGAAGLAIKELEDAEASGIGQATVKWRLVDLYCDTGQPEKAEPYLDNIGDDPNMSTGPGTAPFRQGRVYFLLGNYATANELWSQLAIEQLKAARTTGVIQSSVGFLRGQSQAAARAALDVPGQILQQAEWEYLLAISLLEGGRPLEAGPRFQKALRLNPELGGRAVAEEYLSRMGLEIPAAPVVEAEAEAGASAPAAPAESAPAAPAEQPKAEEAKPAEAEGLPPEPFAGEKPAERP